MSSLSTLPKGDSAWLLRKAVERIMQQVSVLETNIGSSTTGNSANTQIIFNDAGTLRGDAGLTYNKTTDALTITGDLTVNTNVLKVDTTNDRVGIGTATPGNTLHVIGGNAGQLLLDNGNQQYTQLLFQRNSALNTGGDILIDGTASTFNFRTLAANMPFVWQLSASAGSPTTAMTLNASGNLVFPSAKGIDFSAVTGGTGTATANVLNDYEEGTFTPAVAGSTDAGSASYTRSGYYTKVGRLVTITVYMNWTAHTGTGNMRFTGLPFTSANLATNYNGISIGYVNNIALTAGNVLYGLLEFGTTYVTATQSPTGGGAYSLVPIDTSAEIAFTATYFV